jgi:sugar phosphate isomerase/epimerase
MNFAVGVQGYPLAAVSRLKPGDLERVRTAGAEVVGLYMTERERAEPTRWAGRLAARLADAGLRCVHLVGPASRLIAHDERARRRAVATVGAGIEAVAALGAERLFVQPGGFSDRGPWWWHPLNYAPASRSALARSLRQLGDRAEAAGVGIVVEGAQTSVMESPAVMREVIENAGSPAVTVNLDYVNFLTPPLVARFGEAFAAMVAELGPRVTSVHFKDAIVWPRLSAHVEEVQAGDGVLDLRTVVAYARAAGVPVLVEHLRAPRADDAIAYLAALAGAR